MDRNHQVNAAEGEVVQQSDEMAGKHSNGCDSKTRDGDMELCVDISGVKKQTEECFLRHAKRMTE